MKKTIDNNKLAIQMLVAMVSGIVVGLGFMAIRENAGADSALWSALNSILFQNISAAGGEQALGLFYIGGQLFIRALQLVIVPMVFSSVVMAICEVNEARTLGRIAGKTIGWFMMTTTIALTLENGESPIVIQSILDGVLPKMIPLALTLGLYFLMKKKGWTPVVCIAALLVLGLVGAFFGVF
jgi:mannose/fructose/N-acetylgalactosamine-specific phosphotransferase system component IID